MLKIKSLIGSFKEKAIFHVILEIDSFEPKNALNMGLPSKPPLKKTNTVHNLITISIVSVLNNDTKVSYLWLIKKTPKRRIS